MTKKKSTRFQKVLVNVVAIILVLVALVLIFNRQLSRMMIHSYQPTVSAKMLAENKNKQANYDFDKVNALDFQTVAKARLEHKSINAIGLLNIPSIGLNLPIANGLDNETLALAAGTLKPNQKMGQANYALASHHVVAKDILFGPLYWKSRPGQKIYLTDLKNVYEYTTYQRKFIPATDVKVVDDVPGKQIITLITCDDTGDKRLMVRGKFNKVYKYKDAPKEAIKGFTKSFKVLK
ncbi:class A sortase [Periweissella cryptocerci]|uniref:Class A sortase n=1 Tax=Periweissella cryptocerci TaxID=2506420 RepID=A0A4P6YTQ2_9LACO|nr:class A sortase [Periweissella cryptocerci]QBO36066.1 class A sortase [Periweissella cryptocerci]